MIPNFYDRINSSSRNPRNSTNNNDTNDNSENSAGSRNIHVYDSESLEGIIASRQEASTLTPTPTTTSTNRDVLNNFGNIRLGVPVCILRAPEDLNLPSSNNNDETPSDLSAILLPPTFGSVPSDQSAETVGGKFADKLPLHVIPVEGGENNDLFTNRISYNTQVNGYYENGILSKKYLNKWQEGAYQWDNIELKREYDWSKTYLARDPSDSRMNDDGEISWKFDYRPGDFIIHSLRLRLSFGTFDSSARVNWSIKPLPTMKDPNPTWQPIQFDPYTESRHYVNEIKDVTRFVKDEYGFILKAHLSGGEEDHVIWQKTQLFRQDFARASAEMNLSVDDDETFGLDVRVELRPDIVVEPSPEPFVNDESTSDFVIHLEVPTSDEVKDFHVHSKILSSRSDYFNALLESNMIESQNKSLTLSQISRESLETILNFLYTGTLPEISTYDQWVTLLHDASRFLIPTLVQRCEKALKGYLNDDNLREIEAVAEECGAEQLLQYCKMLEPKGEQS